MKIEESIDLKKLAEHVYIIGSEMFAISDKLKNVDPVASGDLSRANILLKESARLIAKAARLLATYENE